MRTSPRRLAAVGGVAVAAIVAGIAFGVVIAGDEPATGAAPTQTLSPSSTPVAAVSPSYGASESVDPSPSVSPAPPGASSVASGSPDPTATPDDGAISVPSPSSEGGFGGVGGDFEITGEWERLAPMPGDGEFTTADALILPDGRIAVFRYFFGDGPAPAEHIVVYDRETETWETVTFADEAPFIATDQSFVLAGEERIYTFQTLYDPSTNPWTAEPFQLVRDAEGTNGSRLAAGGDGRIYRRAQDTGSFRTELIAYDPETDTFERTEPTLGIFDRIHAGPDGDIVLFGRIKGIPTLLTYDTASQSWSSPVEGISDAIDTTHAAVGMDGNVYVTSEYPDAPKLWALSLDDGTMQSVEPPDDVSDWQVELLWTPDGQLFAFGREEVWAFVPDE